MNRPWHSTSVSATVKTAIGSKLECDEDGKGYTGLCIILGNWEVRGKKLLKGLQNSVTFLVRHWLIEEG